MPSLKQLANRLLPPRYRHPPPPVQAANSFPTMVCSADDDVQPSPRLLRLALEAVRAAEEEVCLDEIARSRPVPAYFNSWPGEHYRLLGGLMLALRPRRVLEIGTYTGLSSLAMEKYLPPGGRIVSFDLVPWDTLAETALRPEDFAGGRLVQQIGDLADPAVVDRHRAFLKEVDFMFIDGPKDGRSECAFMDNFRTIAFRHPPILLFDDTRLWSMLRFWRSLPWPKLDLTSFGHWSGSGLVEFETGGRR